MAGGYISVRQAFKRAGTYETIGQVMTKMSAEDLRFIEARLGELQGRLTELQGCIAQSKNNARMYSRIGNLAKSIVSMGAYGNSASLRPRDAHKDWSVQKSELFEANNLKTVEPIIVSIYRLEHEILDKMSGGATATVDYDIYWSGPEEGQIYGGTLPVQEVDKHLGIDNKGSVVLRRSVVEAAKQFSTSLANKSDKTINIADLEVFQQMAADIATFFAEISASYNNLVMISKKTHLGDTRDAKYDTYEQVLTAQIPVEEYAEELRRRYLNQAATNAMINIPSAINRGHLMEAYSRLLREEEGTYGDARSGIDFFSLVADSLGNDPWYISGDVKNTQVKSYLDNASYRNVASLESILQLAKQIIFIAEFFVGTKKQPEKYAMAVEKIISPRLEKAQPILDKKIEGVSRELLKQRLSLG